MILGIAGSRDWPKERLGEIEAFIRNLSGVTGIVTGDAKGVDRQVVRVGNGLGLPVESLEADWDRYGNSAGIIRNQEVVRRADSVVVFWSGNRESRGTLHVMAEALAHGKLAHVFMGCDPPTIFSAKENAQCSKSESRQMDMKFPPTASKTS